MRPALVVSLVAAALACPRRACADVYDRAMARATEAESRGDYAAAAAVLERVVPLYPQDYSIATSLGAAYYGAGRYKDAERAYRVASARAPDSDDARLGLGWSLAREDRCADATATFRSLLGTASDGLARDGLASCAHAPPAVTVVATGNEYLFPDHPWKSSGTGVTGEVDALLGSRWTIDGAYRYTRVATLPSSAIKSFSQNEGYADAGLQGEKLGLTLRAALIADGSGQFGTWPHFGVSGRWSPAGDLLLDATVSGYEDMAVFRVSPRWFVRVAGPLGLEPGFAAQDAGGHAYASGSLAATLTWTRISAWVGGKYGEEVRPAYLDAHVVYDIPEHVMGGAWAGVRARVAGPVGLVATYAFDWLRRTDSLQPSESGAHAFALGPYLDL